jgi:hypothetical protein
MRNASDKRCRENQNTHFTFNSAFLKIIPFMTNVEKYCREGQATDDHMEHAQCMHCMPMATAHTQNIVKLIAFPLPEWLHEQASMLRCLYISSLVLYAETNAKRHMNLKSGNENSGTTKKLSEGNIGAN